MTTLSTSKSSLASPTAVGGASNSSTAPPQFSGATSKEGGYPVGSVVALVGFCVIALLF